MILLKLAESSHAPVFTVTIHSILCLHGKAQKACFDKSNTNVEMLKRWPRLVCIFPVWWTNFGRQLAAGGQISDCWQKNTSCSELKRVGTRHATFSGSAWSNEIFVLLQLQLTLTTDTTLTVIVAKCTLNFKLFLLFYDCICVLVNNQIV